MKKCKLLLFDLDGTLLQSDKTISTRTLSALKKCRGNDILIGVSTSRSEQNSLVFLNELMPDILISSGGALVKYKTEYIYRAEFSEEETNVMIDMARNICGNDCEITIDTIDAHYWNYKIDPKKLDKSWGDSIYTDFSDFNECSLKMCVEIFNQDKADKLTRSLSDCDCIRFSDGFWYKFTKKNVTKENAIMKITEVCGFSTDSIIAFGDDYADIGMLELCGTGVARDMTKKLGALAEKYQCAILLIGHMNKASGNKAAYRGMGSIDFFAVARSVLLVGRIEGEPNTRAVVQIKNNLAAFGHPKAFMLSETGFRWLGDYEITADEVLGGIAPKANKLEQAKQMLRELAETTNMVQSNEVFEMADEQGISKRTMENAKKELGIRAKKINNSWYWELDTVKQR